ncbi:C-C motif chemokine 4 homolog [Sceloporus undulatus]|uniref:C-C motif chemokine 4 homolog n=1 Tax=Sceloporus undulatus TaxID=8520 RepID=UPI001C4C7A82|nr:C-C motif chemokine 4 homolog [Sceloporus undulatus]
MANLKKVLLVAFLLALSYQYIAEAAGPSSPRDCCFAYWDKRPLRIRNIASYYSTDSECNLKAIVFVMKNGKQICVNSAETWVQRALPNLNEMK